MSLRMIVTALDRDLYHEKHHRQCSSAGAQGRQLIGNYGAGTVPMWDI